MDPAVTQVVEQAWLCAGICQMQCVIMLLNW
jgi:hypothetical protein